MEVKKEIKLPGYRCLGTIGKGAFGTVFLVRDLSTGGEYACKAAWGGRERTLLRREAAMQSAIPHPATAKSVCLIKEADCLALVMEYIEGISLKRLREKGGCTEELAVRIGVQLAEWVRFLQEREEPLLYRDWKPEHILLQGERVRVLDLGCVCTLPDAVRSAAGTKGFAAPELLAPGECSPGFSADVYGVGKILSFLVPCGERGRAYGQMLEAATAQIPGRRIPNGACLKKRLEEIAGAGRHQGSGRRTMFCVEKDAFCIKRK